MSRLGRAWRSSLGCVAITLLASCDAAILHVGPEEPFAHPPARPPAVTEGPDARELFLALGQPVLVQSNPTWRHVGFDLDGIETSSEDGAQECLSMGETSQIDGEGGIDNVFGGEISTTLEFVFPGFAAAILDAMTAGRGTVLVRAAEWNGQADDPRVRVDVVQSVDGTTEDPAGLSFDGVELVRLSDGTPASDPAWSGADRWFVRGDAAGDPAVHTDLEGYVADGVLVFRIDGVLDVRYFYGAFAGLFRLRDTVFTVALDDPLTGCGTTMVGGRAGVEDLLAIAEYVGYCEGSPDRAQLDAALRVNADLLVAGSFVPGATCDAISVGLRFDACAPGVWSVTVEVPPLPDPCP